MPENHYIWNSNYIHNYLYLNTRKVVLDNFKLTGSSDIGLW